MLVVSFYKCIMAIMKIYTIKKFKKKIGVLKSNYFTLNGLAGILLISISEKTSLVWKFEEVRHVVGKWVQME